MMTTFVKSCLAKAAWVFPPGGIYYSSAIGICTILEFAALCGSSVRSDQFLAVGRARLFLFLATSPMLWLTTAWLIYWYGWVLWNICGGLGKRLTLLVSTIAALPLGLYFSVYLVSWGFCIRSGVLPDSDVLRFVAINCSMLWKYLLQTEPHVLWELAAIVVAAYAISLVIIFRLLTTIGRRPSEVSIAPLGFAVLVSANLVLMPTVFGDSEDHLQNRVAVVRNPNPPLLYDVTHRLNPVVAWCRGWVLQKAPDSSTTIPVDALTPRSARSAANVSRPVADTAEPRPNVLLIVVESLRADVIGLVHQQIDVVPNISRLSREGAHFTRAYAQSVHSDYADPCIVSSQYPLRYGYHYFYQRHVPWPKVMVWDALKPFGYSTAMFSSQNEAWSNMHLFYDSASLDLMFDSRSAATDSFMPADEIFASWAAKTELAGKLDDRLTARTAINWITKCEEARQPWLCTINFQTSHFPYPLPREEPGTFHPGKIDFEASLFHWDKRHTETVYNAYFNALHYIDDRVGEIRAVLDRCGATERTIIVVVGDHGEAMGEVNEVGHAQSLLETVCRVPLVFHFPGHIPIGRHEYLSQSIDIVPTILGLAGQRPHPAFQGIDLLASDRLAPQERVVFVHCIAGGIGEDAIVCNAGWKLVKNHNQQSSLLQFRPTDLKPSIEYSAEFPDVFGILSRCLDQWRDRQLTYYRESRYHELFYAPQTPTLTEADAKLLAARARQLEQRIESPISQ